MNDWQVPTVGGGTPVPQPQVAGPSNAPASAGGTPVFFEAGTKAPSTGSFWSPSDWENCLHLWLGNTGIIPVDTQWGQKDGVKCNAIVVFTTEGDFELYQNQEVIQTVLVRQIASKRNIVGRLAKGNQAEAGKQPPWVIADPSDADIQQANTWLGANATQQGQDIVLNFF